MDVLKSPRERLYLHLNQSRLIGQIVAIFTCRLKVPIGATGHQALDYLL